jgi:tetratricopeptide (TPR) repeat protein
VGQSEGADAVLSEAVERGRAAGELAVAADAAVALADLRSQRPADTGIGRDEVLREIEAAIQVFEERGDDEGLGRAVTLRGKFRFWSGEAAAALPDLERGARLARKAGNRAEEAESIQMICAAMRVGPTPVAEALQRVDALGARAALTATLEVVFLAVRALLVAAQGRFDAARSLAAQAIALAEEHGLDVAHPRFVAGYVELHAHDAAAAEPRLRWACEYYEQVGQFGYLSSVAPYLAEAVLAQGRVEEALRLTERWRADRLTLPEDADGQAQWRRVRAKALARSGELEEAERLGREAVAIAAGTADILDLRAETLADLGEVLRLADRPQESRAALEDAVRLYEAKGNVVGAERVRGLLAERPIEA